MGGELRARIRIHYNKSDFLVNQKVTLGVVMMVALSTLQQCFHIASRRSIHAI